MESALIPPNFGLQMPNACGTPAKLEQKRSSQGTRFTGMGEWNRSEPYWSLKAKKPSALRTALSDLHYTTVSASDLLPVMLNQPLARNKSINFYLDPTD